VQENMSPQFAASLGWVLILLFVKARIVYAWLPHTSFHTRCSGSPRAWIPSITSLYSDASISSGTPQALKEDSDEYEYVEYDILREEDFAKSEWLIGTNWENRQNKIEETWVRLAITEDGKNLAVWGDKSEGKWNLDAASQFLSISKENIFGKRIWAGSVDDYYYVQGTVRGWTYWSAAEILGQWQAKRLGVDPEEAGEAPWFEDDGQPPIEGPN
jgi:hypothetical protein